MSTLIFAFDSFSNNPHISTQVHALAKEHSADYRIYANEYSMSHVLEAAEVALEDGYSNLMILVEDIDELYKVERVLSVGKLFESVRAVPAYYPPNKAIRFSENLLLKEATTPTHTLLIIGLLNANPPAKGLSDLIDEILKYNPTPEVSKTLPKLAASGKLSLLTRLYLLPAGDTKHAPLPSNYRSSFLFPSKELPGLYGPSGSSTKKPDALKERSLFIPGSPGVSLIETIQTRVPLTACNHILILGPAGTTVDSLRIPTGQYNLEDGGVIPILSLPAFDIDIPNDSLVALGVAIGKDCATSNQVAKTEQAKALGTLVPSDYATCSLIMTLHLIATGKISPNEGVSSDTNIIGKAEEYMKNIWKAIPEGDRAAMEDLARASGLKDILSVGMDVVKLGKTIAGLGGDKKQPSPDDLKKLEQFRAKFAQMGYDVFKMVGHDKYVSFKSQIDI